MQPERFSGNTLSLEPSPTDRGRNIDAQPDQSTAAFGAVRIAVGARPPDLGRGSILMGSACDQTSDNRIFGKSTLRWSADARLIRTGHGAVAVNYATSTTVELDPDDADRVASVSGLATSFVLPDGISGAAKESLIRGQFLVPSDRFEAVEDLVRQRLAAALHQSHGFIIMPTERCNFRCTYCYESFEKGRMSDENVAALEAAIDRAAGTAPQFSLGFFGGEPLVCADLVLRFSRRAFQVMAARGLPYAASIATNGSLLSPERFGHLLDAGVVSYQITIDGDRATHDSQRVSLGGQGTYDRIVRNLRAMASQDSDFVCILRCNLPPHLRDRALDLFAGSDLEFVRHDRRFIADVHTVWASDRRTVGPHDAGCSAGMPKAVDYYLLNRQLAEHGVRTVTYDQLPAILGKGCYAGKPNWFIVGPDLTLYKCTVVFDNERNRVGRIASDGTVEVDAEKNGLWTGSNALTDVGCAGCHLRVPCGGIACPLSRITTGVKGCLEIRTHSTLQRWAAARPQDDARVGHRSQVMLGEPQVTPSIADPILSDPDDYRAARRASRSAHQVEYDTILRQAAEACPAIGSFCATVRDTICRLEERESDRIDPYHSTSIGQWVAALSRGLTWVTSGADAAVLEYYADAEAFRSDLASEFPQLARHRDVPFAGFWVHRPNHRPQPSASGTGERLPAGLPGIPIRHARPMGPVRHRPALRARTRRAEGLRRHCLRAGSG